MPEEEIIIDQKEAKDLWKDILEIADKYAPIFAATFLRVTNKQQKGINESSLLAAITSMNQSAIDKVLGWENYLKEMLKLQDIFRKTAFESADKTAKILEVELNPKMSYAFRYINEFASLQIKNVNAETIQAINELLRRSFTGELTTTETTAYIKRFIGLDSRRINALINYENALIKDGFNRQDIKRLVEQKRNEYLRERAETIARTESMSASNQGNLATYKDMVDRGIITKDKYWLGWMVTPDDRLCDKCRAMKTKYANIGENFYNEGAKYQGERMFLECPPLHPRCRCTTYLTKK